MNEIEVASSEGYDLSTSTGFKKFIRENNLPETSKTMERAIYIPGDFSKAAYECKNDYNYQNSIAGKIRPIPYNLYRNNCMHYVLRKLLLGGNLTTAQKVSLKLSLHGIRPNSKQGSLGKLGTEYRYE